MLIDKNVISASMPPGHHRIDLPVIPGTHMDSGAYVQAVTRPEHPNPRPGGACLSPFGCPIIYLTFQSVTTDD